MGSLFDRFNAKWQPEPNSGCWLWTAAILFPKNARPTDIRPIIGLGSRKDGTAIASRVSWQLHNGPIPAGIDVCHHCDVPLCVNPDHLFLGTRRENMQDSLRKGRYTARQYRNGGEHPMALLSEVEVIAIRASTEASPVVGAAYGIAAVTVRAIRQRRIWKHV